MSALSRPAVVGPAKLDVLTMAKARSLPDRAFSRVWKPASPDWSPGLAQFDESPGLPNSEYSVGCDFRGWYSSDRLASTLTELVLPSGDRIWRAAGM